MTSSTCFPGGHPPLSSNAFAGPRALADRRRRHTQNATRHLLRRERPEASTHIRRGRPDGIRLHCRRGVRHTSALPRGHVDQQRPTEELRLLTEYLAERDEACPRCGYNLRGLTGGRCPECGDQLRLQIGLLEPRLGPYIALLVAGCLGLGGSALFSILALSAAPLNWWSTAPARLMLGQFVLCALLVPFVLARRHRLRRARPSRQWLWAILAWVMVAALWTAIVVLFDD